MVQSIQHDAVTSTSDAELKQQVALLNLARDGDSLIIGGAMRHPFPEMVEAIQRANAEREKDDERKYSTLLAQLEAQIANNLEQIEFYNQKIDEIDKSIASANKAIEQLEDGALPELDESGKFKDQRLESDFAEWERKNGKADRTDQVALLAAITEMQNEQVITRQSYVEHRDNLVQENIDLQDRHNALEGNRGAQREIINEAQTDVMAHDVKLEATDSYGQDTHNEILDRRASGEGIHTDLTVSASSKDEGFGDFLDFGATTSAVKSIEGLNSDSSMHVSANALEMPQQFGIAASGQIEIPTTSQTNEMGNAATTDNNSMMNMMNS